MQVGPSAHDKLIRNKVNAVERSLDTAAGRWAHGDRHHRRQHHHHHRGAPNHIEMRERHSWRPSIIYLLEQEREKLRKEQQSKNDTYVQGLRRA